MLMRLSEHVAQVLYRLRKILRKGFKRRIRLASGEVEEPGWRQPLWLAVPMIGFLIAFGRNVCTGPSRATGGVLLAVAGLYAVYLVAEWAALLGQYMTSTATSPVRVLVTHHSHLRRELSKALTAFAGTFSDKAALESRIKSMLSTLRSAPPFPRIAFVLFLRLGINFALTIFTLSTVQIAALSLECPAKLVRYAAVAGGYPAVLTDYVLSESVVMLGSQSISPPPHQALLSKLFMALQNFYLTWFMALVVGSALVTAAIVESSLRDRDALAAHFANFITQRAMPAPIGDDVGQEPAVR
jgi:hypothetical protein